MKGAKRTEPTGQMKRRAIAGNLRTVPIRWRPQPSKIQPRSSDAAAGRLPIGQRIRKAIIDRLRVGLGKAARIEGKHG